jgi:HlyD family secretion protein
MNNIDTKDIQKTLDAHKGANKFKKWIYIILLLAIVAVASYFYFFSNNKKVLSYNTVSPMKKDLVVTVSATGNLEPTNSVTVGIEVSGTILDIYVDYNDVVKKGQILAKLDTTKLESQVNSAKAALSIAKANLTTSKIDIKDAKRELDRLQELYKATDGNFPSAKELDAAMIAYDKSKASYEAILAQKEQAQANLESKQEDLKKAVVVSPIDGVVLDKAIEVGQSVVSSMQIPTLFTLAEDLKNMEVIVSVDEADVGDVKKDQKVTFSVDAYPNKTFEGVIKKVRMNSVIVNNVVTYETVVSVENSDLLLRPGMTVSADITTKVIKDAMLVPNAALRFAPPRVDHKKSKGFNLFKRGPRKKREPLSLNSKKLWILKGDKTIPLHVETGETDGINRVVISDKLSLDDKVITGIKEGRK